MTVWTGSATVKRREFAAILKCKPSYVTQLAAAGRLVLTDDGREVIVQASLDRIRTTASPERHAVADRHARARGSELALAPAPAQSLPMDEDNDAPPSLPAGSAGLGDGDRYQKARAAREQFLALQAKLDYEERIGQLVKATDVAAIAAQVGATVRQRLESLPSLISAQIDERDRARIHGLLTAQVEQICADLARSFTPAATRKESA